LASTRTVTEGFWACAAGATARRARSATTRDRSRIVPPMDDAPSPRTRGHRRVEAESGGGLEGHGLARQVAVAAIVADRDRPALPGHTQNRRRVEDQRLAGGKGQGPAPQKRPRR